MAKRKQDENLIPFNKLSESEVRRMASNGGKKSGEVRKRKADMRRMAQDILNGTFKTKQGKDVTGYEIILQGIMANLADVKSRNWGKSIDVLLQLSGAYMTKEQVAKLKAETKLTQAKIKAMESGGSNADVEDLAPLAQLLLQKPQEIEDEETEDNERDENTDD